jgi:hypothetical protein
VETPKDFGLSVFYSFLVAKKKPGHIETHLPSPKSKIISIKLPDSNPNHSSITSMDASPQENQASIEVMNQSQESLGCQSCPVKEGDSFEYVEMPKRKSSLKKDLKKKGYSLKKNVAGDGNCQFRAVADQLQMDDDKCHTMLRKKSVQWLRENKNLKIGEADHFNSGDWETFCDYMDLDGNFGDHITLIALANQFSLQIEVIHETGANVIVPENKKFDKKIFLLYCGEHYMSILPLKEIFPLESFGK